MLNGFGLILQKLDLSVDSSMHGFVFTNFGNTPVTHFLTFDRKSWRTVDNKDVVNYLHFGSNVELFEL